MENSWYDCADYSSAHSLRQGPGRGVVGEGALHRDRGIALDRHRPERGEIGRRVAHQEVDVACGLERSYVLAMECKVSNDETNSVKRVNDVLKKAAAWKAHWGNFVMTAALLQGVIAPKDVQRLTDAGVYVFWSHDLEEFLAWLSAQMT